MHDVIIIGAGPAGMTAGIYTARKKLKTLILAEDVGGQMVYSSDVENYTGFSMISGADLSLKFREHLASIPEDLELREGVAVAGLEKHVTTFVVHDRQGNPHYSKAVIICSGRKPKKLGIPGEERLFGKGLAVCAACDAPLYKNKDVAVIGGGNSAMDALLTLSRLARRVYSVNNMAALVGDEILKAKVIGNPAITFFPSSTAAEIVGAKTVEGIKVRDHRRRQQYLPVSGVFVEIGWEPNVAFDNLSQKNRFNEIMVDGNLQTNISGLFAAGDCNDSKGEQIVIAAGEGAKAALAAADFLAKLR